MTRLSTTAFGNLPRSIRRFSYDRSALKPGIVHLGTGAFHRAHQAVAIEHCLEQGETEWAILGSSLRSRETSDALSPQKGLYALSVRDGSGEQIRVIGSILDVITVPDAPSRLMTALTAPSTRIVSLTITEKGYCHDPATGELNEDHPDIRHDLVNPGSPRSAIGLIAAALESRRAAGLKPFTLLTCDNLPANGRTLKRVVDRFAALKSRDLGAWVQDQVLCPSSMVDRIVPATTDEDRARISQAMGLEDRWPIVTEPFTQWVLEDRFSDGRPDLASAGVELVSHVTPFEHMKLRLLNGSHSTLAYLGYLAGHETVADAMAAPGFEPLIRALMREEAGPTLAMPVGTDIPGYQDALIERFRNPALKHRTWQIAMDGSQKLPQRLLNTIRDRLKSGAPIDRLALGVAAWMRYVTGLDEKGGNIDVRDPLAEELRRITDEAGPVAARLAPALLAVKAIFGSDLPNDQRFTSPVTSALEALYAKGAARVVAEGL